MQLSVGDYEIAAFFGCVALFEICERIWPARDVDRWRDLKLDVLSFAFALVVNRVCNHLFRNWVGDLTPASLAPLVHYLQNLPSVIKIILALFMVDFVIYWIHRGQHRFNLLGRTHSWHHPIEHMYWSPAFPPPFFHSFIHPTPQVFTPKTLLKPTPKSQDPTSQPQSHT